MKKNNWAILLFVAIMMFAAVGHCQKEGVYFGKKNTLNFDVPLAVGFSTGFGNLEKSLSHRAADKIDLACFYSSVSGVLSWFVIDNLAVRLSFGDWAASPFDAYTDREKSVFGLNGAFSGEYFFHLGKDTYFSAAVGIGADEVYFFYDEFSFRTSNVTLPLSLTFWLKDVGFGVQYDPAINRGKMYNNTSMLPKNSGNFVSFVLRSRIF